MYIPAHQYGGEIVDEQVIETAQVECEWCGVLSPHHMGDCVYAKVRSEELVPSKKHEHK